MAFEFLSNLDTTTLFLLLIIFVLFVLSMKKIFSIIMNAIWIAVISILFPIVMNRFFGFDIPTDADSLISFALLGLGVYFVYLIAKSVYKVLGFAERAVKKTMPKREREEKPKEKEEVKEDKNDQESYKEKELEKKEKELVEKEQQLKWSSKIEEGKKKKARDWTKEYAVIEESKVKIGKIVEQSSKKPSLAVTPLPVIEHKPKKRKKRNK